MPREKARWFGSLPRFHRAGGEAGACLHCVPFHGGFYRSFTVGIFRFSLFAESAWQVGSKGRSPRSSPSAEKFKERLHPAGGKASGARCAAAPLRSNTPPSSPSQVLGIFVAGQPVAGLAQRCRCGSKLKPSISFCMPAAPPQVDSRRLQDGRERIDVAQFREPLHLYARINQAFSRPPSNPSHAPR